MDFGMTIIVSIYQIAKQIGLTQYIKKIPEKTVNAVYQKLIQDEFVESPFSAG